MAFRESVIPGAHPDGLLRGKWKDPLQVIKDFITSFTVSNNEKDFRSLYKRRETRCLDVFENQKMKTYAVKLALAVALLVFASLVSTGEGFHTPFPGGKRQIHENKKFMRQQVQRLCQMARNLRCAEFKQQATALQDPYEEA
ncbi:hypothetical protein P5673_013187 [Acropora cervicornis]|uniref:Uncharacterized protein n=1 Tax=Acropora cervicornis TaxID=6130 RepID=A0AAD9QLH0_ACRCE|nr:hypothetical protein P5673_013187 [Acropora cervicornis]